MPMMDRMASNLEGFFFRNLHSDIVIEMASDRHGGWTGQIYTAGQYARGVTQRTHKVGEKTFVERVLPNPMPSAIEPGQI